MRAYIAYDEGGIEELGEVDRDGVVPLIGRADAALSKDRQFGVGFYRSKKDFLEVRPVGKSEYLLWSDLIARTERAGFLGLFSRRKAHIDKIVAGREAAAAAVYCYMDHPREAFERKYG